MMEVILIIGFVAAIALQALIAWEFKKSLGLYHDLLKSAQDDNRRMVDALMIARDKAPVFNTGSVETFIDPTEQSELAQKKWV